MPGQRFSFFGLANGISARLRHSPRGGWVHLWPERPADGQEGAEF
jgi:hypothetical protein